MRLAANLCDCRDGDDGDAAGRNTRDLLSTPQAAALDAVDGSSTGT